jgi:hypothetical protein
MSDLLRVLVTLGCGALGALVGYFLAGYGSDAAGFHPAGREGVRVFLGVPVGLIAGIAAGVWYNTRHVGAG